MASSRGPVVPRGEKPPGPGRPGHRFRMKVRRLRTGDHLEHALDVDGFRTARIDDAVLPDGLEERRQIVFAVQFEEDIVIEIHEDQGHGPPMMADAAVLQFELMGGGQDAGNALHGIQSFGQIDVLRHLGQGLFFGHHGQQAGIAALSLPVDGQQHLCEAHHRVEQGMVEVQVDTGGPDRVESVPDDLGDLLGHALIIPAARAAEIPLRMITAETGHVTLLAAACVPMKESRSLPGPEPCRQTPPVWFRLA
jgi:hypothetical protein